MMMVNASVPDRLTMSLPRTACCKDPVDLNGELPWGVAHVEQAGRFPPADQGNADIGRRQWSGEMVAERTHLHVVHEICPAAAQSIAGGHREFADAGVRRWPPGDCFNQFL